jgi:hypothetical protein
MDQANYKQDNQTAWAAVQVQANPRLAFVANTFWASGAASIYGLNYDPGALESALTGLDYRLMSSAFSGFSNLKMRQFVHNVGANYRLSDNLILNTVFEFNHYNDVEPYLFDSAGNYTSFVAGLNWVF